jgi:hypothetical protein
MSMKPLAAIALLCTPALLAQQPSTPDDTHASSITMRSNLVVVPALV